MRSRGWTSGQRRGATSHRRRLTRLTAVAELSAPVEGWALCLFPTNQ